MKKFMISLCFLLTGIGMYAQDIELTEVVVSAVNYKYLQGVGSAEAAIPVKLLEEKAARYDIKASDLYDDMYETYNVSFYIPDGKVVAAYDRDGNIIRTIEKFSNVSLPEPVRNAIYKRFPNWQMVENIYRVNYHTSKGLGRKDYQIKLINGDETVRVKVDENGNFM